MIEKYKVRTHYMDGKEEKVVRTIDGYRYVPGKNEDIDAIMERLEENNKVAINKRHTNRAGSIESTLEMW